MSRICLLIGLLVSVLLASVAGAGTYKLTDGSVVSGDILPTTATEGGIQVKTGDGAFQQVSWTSFSQEDLKQLAREPKLASLIEPFIEANTQPSARKPLVKLQAPPRLGQPVAHSLLGALLSTGLGFIALLLIYSANLYAAYEISLFRAQSAPLVCGVSAVLPIIGPIIFLSMSTRLPTAEVPAEAPPEGGAETVPGAVPVGTEPAADTLNPMQANGVAHPASLKLAHEEPHAPTHVPSTTYQRGQFTFNRRFFETKFPGFFGVVRREADKDMVMVIKSTRGEFFGQRISRIAANDLHLEVHRGAASEEVMIPFIEIQQIVLKHKDSK